MTVENQENRVRKAPLIFIVSPCGFVVAARTRQFQLHQSTSEQVGCPSAQRPTADPIHEINPEQSLRELRRETHSLKSSKVELLVFLFFGLGAVVATLGCFAELFHLLGKAPLVLRRTEQDHMLSCPIGAGSDLNFPKVPQKCGKSA